MSYHLQEENNYPKALWIASGIMGALVLLGFFVMIGSALPQFGMGGIIVNYGTADVGMGDDYMTVDEASADPNANEVRPDRVDPEETVQPTPSQQVTEQSVVTQDMDDAPAVVANDKKKANAPEATVEKKDSKPAVNPNALYKGPKNNATGKGDGTGTVAGNQGSKLGDPLAANYGEGGSGDGNMGLSIKNRGWAAAPNTEDLDPQRKGTVMVEVRVGRDGRIVYAKVVPKGTTLSDPALWNKLERAVLQARFNTIENAPVQQVGLLPFNFDVK